MRSVQLDEFSRRPAEYLESGESLSIERDGRVIGRYIPITTGSRADGSGGETTAPTIDEETHRALERLREALAQIYAETGLTEDEFADLMDPSKPFPYDDPPRG